MKRILIDCDGVLSDFIGGALRILNTMLGTTYVPDDVTGWDFTASLGLDKQTASSVKRALDNAQGFAYSLEPYPGARSGIALLSRVANVYIVTSPWNTNPTWTYDRERWLKHYFNIPSSCVIHTSAKHVCVGDIFVDDKTETCQLWQSAHPAETAVQWITPHNRRDPWSGPSTCDWSTLAGMAL